MVQLIESLEENDKPLGDLEFVELTWHERSHPRQRCKTDRGRELALALPRGTVLCDLDVLSNTKDGTIIVKAKPEPVVVIEAANESELCMVAHQLGNWHRALQFETGNRILTECDEVLLEWLQRNNIAYKLETCKYHPNMREIQHKISVCL
jgi:urease accessory protein